ncbi:MAG: hypothetical protein LUD01_01335 [Clostridiales bacterium]|nr:hypothetical protein [Clostridiales bacterium]
MASSGMCLIVIKGSKSYDVTDLVESVTWKGRFGSSSRTLTATLVDDSGYKHARSGIDVESGHQCYFSYDGTELFRGIIMSQTQTQKKKLKFTAYDNGIYLANNKDTFVYENKTADQVFKDVCTRFGLPVDEVASCSYKIPDLTKSKTTGFDAIADALSLDYDATGIKHYVFSDKGKLSLKTRRQNIKQWVIEVGQNLSTYSYTRSIEDVKTRIKMVSSEGTTLAEKSDSALEAKIGVMQDIQVPDESLTTAQIKDLIATVLKSESTPERTMNVTAMGLTDVISGIGVYIIIPDLDISNTFYVDEDTHTFKDQSHTMSLKLIYATDLDAEEKTSSGSSSSSDYAVGDEVTFNGGYHYVSSNASSPTGGTRKSGKAKITLIAKGAKHPYHLIGGAYNSLSGNCNVYGWVDSGTFS